MTNNALLKIIFLTGLALIAFAANSVLCRLALGSQAIDPASFTVIRLLSGTLVLLILVNLTRRNRVSDSRGSWFASFMLFLYAIAFSYAYISLDTGTGALILFGAVQITMILVSIVSGTRLNGSEWMGLVIAFAGFVYMVLPGVSAPPFVGFLLMTLSGIAWGIYTLKGRKSKNPLMDTAYNFLRTTPLILILAVFAIWNIDLSYQGVLLALISGGITSGIGYTIWYMTLGGLSSTQAAVLQLSVPVIAALGGVVFVSEPITLRLTVSAAMILGGILIVIWGKYYSEQYKSNR